MELTNVYYIYENLQNGQKRHDRPKLPMLSLDVIVRFHLVTETPCITVAVPILINKIALA